MTGGLKWCGYGHTLADMHTTECGSCGESLNEGSGLPEAERTPCPSCGSLGRAIGMTVTDSIGTHDSVDLKLRGAAGGRPKLESRSGADMHRASQTWSEINRVIDRETDRYIEKVIAADGTVVRDVNVSLSEHRGHGSDRSAPKGHP